MILRSMIYTKFRMFGYDNSKILALAAGPHSDAAGILIGLHFLIHKKGFWKFLSCWCGADQFSEGLLLFFLARVLTLLSCRCSLVPALGFSHR